MVEFPGSTTGPWARYVHDADARGIGAVRYPRLVPNDDDCAKKLQKRTLTNSTTNAPPGSTWPTRNSTPPPSPPTAGRRIWGMRSFWRSS